MMESKKKVACSNVSNILLSGARVVMGLKRRKVILIY